MILMESDVFWTKPVGKSPVGQANNAQAHAKKKSHRSLTDSDRIHRNPLDSHGNRWGRVKSSRWGIVLCCVVVPLRCCHVGPS
jgi:hypothetical protein